MKTGLIAILSRLELQSIVFTDMCKGVRDRSYIAFLMQLFEVSSFLIAVDLNNQVLVGKVSSRMRLITCRF